MISANAGLMTLGIYAVLLAAGGLVGYLKAGSRPSLIAGIASAIGVAIALFVGLSNDRLGMSLGAVIALILASFFGYRFVAKTRKFMPAGLMALISVIVLVVTIVRLV